MKVVVQAVMIDVMAVGLLTAGDVGGDEVTEVVVAAVAVVLVDGQW